jgi:hypothetical protein
MGDHDSYSDNAALVQRSRRVKKNSPFILRGPQDERRSSRNHWRFSVHAELVEAFIGFFRRIQKGTSYGDT